jgi:AcrR family transcriptional regulator
MAARDVLTAKGARQAEAILDAAVACLGRDGYSATTLQRVADEAGVQKRMVVYYFGSREGLVEAVVRRIEAQLLTRLEDTVDGLDEPAELMRAGFGHLWGELTRDHVLATAYFGLVAESVTDPALAEWLAGLREQFRDVFRRSVAEVEAAGHRPLVDPETLSVLLAAALHGFSLDYLERGDSKALRDAIELTQSMVPLAFSREGAAWP